MFCTECGIKLPEGSKFCPACGVVQGVEEVEPMMDDFEVQVDVEEHDGYGGYGDTSEDDFYYDKPVDKYKKVKILVGVGIGAVAFIALAIWILSMVFKPTINLNDYITVKYDGYDTLGTATCVFDWEEFEDDYGEKLGDRRKRPDNDSDEDYNETTDWILANVDKELYSTKFITKCIGGKLNKDNNLRNGDKIVFEWSCDDERALKKFGYKLEYSNIEFTVSDLEIAETFDPFKDINLGFEGMDGEGIAFSLGTGNSDVPDDITYIIDKEDTLSNGDIVTMSIIAPEYQDPVDYCLENYGKIPSTTSKEFIVEGLNSYVKTLSDISDEAMNDMKDKAVEVLELYVDDFGYDDTELISQSYVGAYLLTKKDEDSYGTNNTLYLLYKVKVSNEYSIEDNDYTVENEFYWYISYDNILTNGKGDNTIDINYYDVVYNTYEVFADKEDEYGYKESWYYSGYETIDDFYEAVVEENESDYNCETGTGGGNADNKKEADDEKEEGIIFTNSSDELLTEDDIDDLSKEEIQSAINEIYARNGYIFETPEKLEFYEKFDWYEPTVKKADFTKDLFNDVEKENVDLLEKARDKK